MLLSFFFRVISLIVRVLINVTTNVIIESAVQTGKLFKDVFLKTTTQYYTIKFAKFLGYEGDPNNRYAILRFFQSLSSLHLVEGVNQFYNYLAKVF